MRCDATINQEEEVRCDSDQILVRCRDHRDRDQKQQIDIGQIDIRNNKRDRPNQKQQIDNHENMYSYAATRTQQSWQATRDVAQCVSQNAYKLEHAYTSPRYYGAIFYMDPLK